MECRRILCSLAAVVALGAAGGDAAPNRLSIDVYPRFTAAPAAVRVRAMVPPDDHNRSLQFVADAGGYYRSSFVALDGANAAAITEMLLKNLPAGRYSVTVILTDAEGHETAKSNEVVVTGTF